MPRKMTSPSFSLQGLVGKAALYKKLDAQIKEMEKQKKDLRAGILSDVKDHGKRTNNGFELIEGGLKITVNVQVREKFDHGAAMDILNSLDENVADQYLIPATNKDLMASAYMQKAIDSAQLSTCFTETPVEVLKVQDDS